MENLQFQLTYNFNLKRLQRFTVSRNKNLQDNYVKLQTGQPIKMKKQKQIVVWMPLISGKIWLELESVKITLNKLLQSYPEMP